MIEAQLQATKSAEEVVQKFDYYFITVVGAVLAYSIQHFSPIHNWILSILEAIALSLLVVSFWFCYRKLEASVGAAGLGHSLITDQTHIAIGLQALEANRTIESDQGVLMPDQIKLQIHQKRQNIQATNVLLEQYGLQAHRAYRLRLRFFAAGLVALLVVKTLQAVFIR